MTFSEATNKYFGKPYYSLDAYCKENFHTKCYKIALDAHMTCPNRDGSKGVRGCIFCSEGGSGDFSVPIDFSLDMQSQIDKGISLFGGKKIGCNFIAYFQAYTNTYAKVDYLEKVYRYALDNENICGISIATRPDCLPDEVYKLLKKLKTEYKDKFIWIELGLQTIHEETALYINRGYTLPCFVEALNRLKALDIPVIVHVILGLPGENKEMMLETINFLNKQKPFGIKLQLLHVLKNTELFREYLAGKVRVLEKDEYLDILMTCIASLSPDICIHRVTGDGPKDLCVAPLFSLNKRDVLNTLHSEMKKQGLFQGCLLSNTNIEMRK